MSDDESPPPKPESSGGSKTPKILLALMVLNLGASGFTTFKVVTTPAAEAAPHSEHEAPAADVVGPIVPLDPFVVNLDEPGQSRYLKVTFQLELTKADFEAQLTNSKQLLRDTILSHLSGLHLADTLGAAAKDKLRTDLLVKIEKLIGANKVRRIFFGEFVVQ